MKEIESILKHDDYLTISVVVIQSVSRKIEWWCNSYFDSTCWSADLTLVGLSKESFFDSWNDSYTYLNLFLSIVHS